MSEPVFPTEEQLEIREVVRAINDAWLQKRGKAMTDALRPCFAENVVMRGPGFVMLGVGREFAVQSYVDFVAHAGVKAFSLEEPQIDVCDHIAAAQYSWEMTYALEGQEYTERGHDLFVLARRAEKWVVVWRAMLPDPARDLAT